MNQNSNAIFTLCSHLCVGEGIEPLEPKEYSILAKKLLEIKKTPSDLLYFSLTDLMEQLNMDESGAKRIMRLIDRNASICFELEKYNNIGIEVVTRADSLYPSRLKKKLAEKCPPIFYYAGDIKLLSRSTIGFAGARNVEQRDFDFTKNAVHKVVSSGYGVVTGGAKGVDTISGNEAIVCDSFSVEYLADSMVRKLKKSDIVKQIQDGKLLLLSSVKPDAGFNVGAAMSRNRYVYAQSEATVVVRSDLNKGGTWAGATENLKHSWCPTLCWNHPYPGNLALIKKGAISINKDWDGKISTATVPAESENVEGQMSLFEADA